MRIRRVTLEVEVPWDDEASTVLEGLQSGLLRRGVRNQAQVVKDEESPNTKVEWSA